MKFTCISGTPSLAMPAQANERVDRPTDLVERRVDRRDVPQVDPHGMGDVVRDVLHVEGHHLGAEIGQQMRGGRAHPRGAADDHRALSVVTELLDTTHVNPSSAPCGSRTHGTDDDANAGSPLGHVQGASAPTVASAPTQHRRGDPLPHQPEFVRYETANGVGTITLDRPPLNAYDPLLHYELEQAWKEGARDPDARVLVLRAAGQALLRRRAARRHSPRRACRTPIPRASGRNWISSST